MDTHIGNDIYERENGSYYLLYNTLRIELNEHQVQFLLLDRETRVPYWEKYGMPLTIEYVAVLAQAHATFMEEHANELAQLQQRTALDPTTPIRLAFFAGTNETLCRHVSTFVTRNNEVDFSEVNSAVSNAYPNGLI